MRIIVFLLLTYLCAFEANGQDLTMIDLPQDSLFEAENSVYDYSRRKKIFWATGITGYSAMASGLYFAWYDNYEQESFHFFNDWDEWRNMDKIGHTYSAYFQTDMIYEFGKWAGYSENKSLMIASIASLWEQLNIELMDGFSSEWGFSVPDVAANVLGTGLFYTQQKLWGHQKLRMKMSYWPIGYSDVTVSSKVGAPPISAQSRSEELFGSGGIERFLKDYNGQTIWLSADLHAIFPGLKIPKFLGLAIGYSARNMLGGFQNTWESNNQIYSVDSTLFPRSSQFVLALDYDLLKIKHSTEFGKALFKILNIFKLPAPGISYDTQEGVKFHLLYLH